MDSAPFKKPGRKTGLFSCRSVIPPFPHGALRGKSPWGPRGPAGRFRKSHIACGGFFVKSHRALILLRLLYLAVPKAGGGAYRAFRL